MPIHQKPSSNKRQREQDQKERAAERSARREGRKARAAARLASGQSGPEIGEPEVQEADQVNGEGEVVLPSLSLPSRPRVEPVPTVRRVYVGNLSYNMDAGAIADLFTAHGQVDDVHIVLDQMTRRPRGFAFVTMGSPTQAQAAIAALDGQEVDGRALRVNLAEARESGPSRGRY